VQRCRSGQRGDFQHDWKSGQIGAAACILELEERIGFFLSRTYRKSLAALPVGASLFVRCQRLHMIVHAALITSHSSRGHDVCASARVCEFYFVVPPFDVGDFIARLHSVLSR